MSVTPDYSLERWLPVVEYEGRYEVSDFGRVRSMPRLDDRKVLRGGHLMTPQTNSRGYVVIILRAAPAKPKLFKVHRLVLQAFVGPCPNGMEGCHGAFGNSDNSLSNLSWDTKIKNSADKVRDGTVCVGARNGRAKLTARDVANIRAARLDGESRPSLALKYGVSLTTISDICLRNSWSHVT